MKYFLRTFVCFTAAALAALPTASCELLITPDSLQNGTRVAGGGMPKPGVGAIVCEPTTCPGPQQVCCVGGAANGGDVCTSPPGGGMGGGGDIYTCSGATNCPGQMCCVALGGGNEPDIALCQDSCRAGSFQVCQTSSECGSGESCIMTRIVAEPICAVASMDAGMPSTSSGSPGTGPMACGAATCMAPRQICCASAANGAADCVSRGFCPTGSDVFTCSSATNCRSGEVCCLTLAAAKGGDLAQCQSGCVSPPGGASVLYQVCLTTSECPTGQECKQTMDAAFPICVPSALASDGGG
jgi:hypothetical protein